MVAGGTLDGGQTQNKLTEIVDLVNTNFTPSIEQLPSTREAAVGTMFGDVPILCGGGTDGTDGYYFDSCISFQNSQWGQSHSMNEIRGNAAGVKINSTTFWILGGSSTSDISDTTEFIIQDQTNGIPGPKLPYRLLGLCSVKLSETEIFVIGGFDGSRRRNESWIYDPQNGFARKTRAIFEDRKIFSFL